MCVGFVLLQEIFVAQEGIQNTTAERPSRKTVGGIDKVAGLEQYYGVSVSH
jgi:hypothetical protein